ncbi:MAG: phage integrase SAM-like domain-containing protein [Flavobacteriaceae bacterium]|nr:phage integrase SAM-like domain-containing protein [Flavobacteriaceae bacterium]
MKARITYVLTPKSDTQGEVWVNLVLEDNNIQKVALGTFAPFSQWDPMHGCIVGDDEQNKEQNVKLNILKAHIKAAYNKAQLKQETIDGNWLSHHVSLCFENAKKTSEKLLLYQIQKYIESAPLRRIKRTGSLGLSTYTIRNLERFYSLIESFEHGIKTDIRIDAIDHKVVSRFKEWLLTEKGYSLNNAGLQVKLLKMICKEADRLGVEVHPYTRHIESFTQRNSDRCLQTLNFEEIKKIKELVGLSASMENTRKWLLIGLSIGQRVSDLLRLNQVQMRSAEHGLYIDIIQQKTDKHVTVGVIDPDVVEILNEDFPYRISQQLFNKQIKELCKYASIDQPVKAYKVCPKTRRRVLGIYPKYSVISSHDLRRSFATNYFGKIETPILMQITGHSKETTFLSYIGQNVNKDAYADAFMKVAATL